MHNRRNLSPALPLVTRFEHIWRPSRWQFAAQVLLAVLAAVALLNCDLPRPMAAPLAAIALLMGLYQGWRHWRKPAQTLFIPPPPGCACIDQQPLHSVKLIERGPLLLLRWKANKPATHTARGQLLFWPDTLSPAQRRVLRLAVHAYAQCDKRQIMAP